MKNQQVLLIGGAGFVGTNLTNKLIEKKYKVEIIDKNLPKRPITGIKYYKTDLLTKQIPTEKIDQSDFVINLAGAPISKKWSKEYKKMIYDSRITITKNLFKSITESHNKPKKVITASAVGYYGDRAHENLTENSKPGDDFLSQVCIDWEKYSTAQNYIELKNTSIKSVNIRTANVLGKGGILYELLPVFKLGLGGWIYPGDNYFPWVHIDDLVNVYIFALENEELSGSINACSNDIVTQKQFMKSLGEAINRPVLFPILPTMLEIKYGELAKLFNINQKVIPQKLNENGFVFKHDNLLAGLNEIMGK